ncbi:MAG: helix-turn-helix domain-containing protein [Actinobacteria bacterium]|nr:helix-turn-helix domain-containing protein [Actinomycetota bacterium]
MTTPNDERLTYTVEEVAQLLGVSRNAAYAAVGAGFIPSIRVGRRIVIPKVALERLLEQSADSTVVGA